MNERIEKLAEQVDLLGNFTPTKVPGHYAGIIKTENIEKFAELIVRECYDTIKKDMELAHIQLIPIDFGIYANGRLRRIIKEHFGV